MFLFLDSMPWSRREHHDAAFHNRLINCTTRRPASGAGVVHTDALRAYAARRGEQVQRVQALLLSPVQDCSEAGDFVNNGSLYKLCVGHARAI
jgi:hypothetical protein